jgi:hypothetical protein
LKPLWVIPRKRELLWCSSPGAVGRASKVDSISVLRGTDMQLKRDGNSVGPYRIISLDKALFKSRSNRIHGLPSIYKQERQRDALPPIQMIKHAPHQHY